MPFVSKEEFEKATGLPVGSLSEKQQRLMDSPIPGSVTNVAKGICPFCKVVVKLEEFKDNLSRTEFKISGLCQKCQDEMFGG